MIALALVAAALMPASCAQVKNPDTLVYLAANDGDSFDPAWSFDGRTHLMIANVYERLLGYKPGPPTDADLIPELATAVPTRRNGLVSADGLTYRFPIREGVRFHDGSTLTPEDVRYSLLRFMLLDRDGGPSALLLEPILGVGTTRRDGKPVADLYERAARAVTVQGGDVVIRLRRPFAPLLSVVAGHGSVVSKRWCVAHGQWDGEAATWTRYNNPKLQDVIPNALADGTGPFRLERYDERDRELVLARFDGYWRKPAALAHVVVKVVPEFSTRKLMLQAGDADVIFAPPIYESQLRGLPGVVVEDGYQRVSLAPFLAFHLKMNIQGNPCVGSGKLDGNGIPADFFADRDVRQAVAYSIDYDAYGRDVERGRARQASGVVPSGLLGHRAGPPAYRLDPAKAAELLKRARGGDIWKRGFRFAIPYTEGRDDFKVLAQIIKKNVEALNPLFHVDVYPMQGSSLMALSHLHQRTISFEQWNADYADADNFAFNLLHTEGLYSSADGYSNPEIDRLIERAAGAADPGERQALYEKVQSLADRDEPVAAVTEAPSIRVSRSWVRGFQFRPIFPESPWGSYFYELSKAP